MKTKKTEKKPKVKLTGQNGNVFNLAGICSKSLIEVNQFENEKEMMKEIFNSGSYKEALLIMSKYCEIS